jgi:Regulator of polyketide synthase expression
MLYPYYAEILSRKQETTLNRMMDSIRDITQLVDPDQLLERILVNAVAVIPYRCFGVLWMYDQASDLLTVRARAGELGEGMLKMQLRPGEGIIGKTFLRGTPKLYKTIDDVVDDFGDMRMENVSHLYDSHQFDECKSIISVPIRIEGKTECVLIVYQNGTTSLLTEADMRLLESFSDQVSIVLTNSRLYGSLTRQNQILRKRDEIHAALMSLSLRNKGAVSVVTELTRMVGLPFSFLDLLDNEWHPKRRKDPGGWTNEKLRALFATERGPCYRVSLPDEEDRAGLAYLHPLASGEDCLGYLIVELKEEMEPEQLLALEQGSSILTLELMRKQSMADFYNKKTQDLFNEMLLSPDPAVYRSRMYELGADPDSDWNVALLELKASVGLQAQSLLVHRFVAFVRERLPNKFAPILFGSGNKVTAVLSSTATMSNLNLVNVLNNIMKEWERSGEAMVNGGVGSSHPGARSLNKSYEEADKALAYQITRGVTGLIRYSDIGVNRLFVRQKAEDLEAFVQDIFAPLRSKRDSGSSLEETLLVYMACGRSANQAAEQLHIHINTLYQRIRKIEEILGLSFDDQENLLRLQLACYLRQTYPISPL